MNNIKMFVLPTLFVLTFLVNTAHADFQIADRVSEFNAMNIGKGISLVPTRVKLLYEISLSTPVEQKNLPEWIWDAYHEETTGYADKRFYFETFCVEPTSPVHWNNATYGYLSYANNGTFTTTGDALTLGVATLYAKFANGTLFDYDYSNPSYTSASLQYLITGFQEGTVLNLFQQKNLFADYLLTINSDISYWLNSYDPAKRYGEIGDYSVFVLQMSKPMNLTNESRMIPTDLQDMLYVMKHDPVMVPEPATAFFWLLLGIGRLFFYRPDTRSTQV